MEKSTYAGIGIFATILVVGFLMNSSGIPTGNVVLGSNGDIVEIKTTLQGFKYNPNVITIKEGSQVRLIIDNKDNVNHGLHLPQFGVVDSVRSSTVSTFEFTAIETPTNGQAVPTCSQEHGEKLTINVI